MKKISFVVLSVLGGASIACSDFSGTWQRGNCTGSSAGEAVASLPLSQTGCESISVDTTTFVIDGKQHSIGGFQYLAAWNEQGSQLSLSLDADLVGIHGNTTFLFAEEGGEKTLSTKATRTFSGETEVLSQCEYRLAK